jgi:hypothetical protein
VRSCSLILNGHFRFTSPDGKAEDIRAAAGEVKTFPAFSRLPENLINKPFEAIDVELKA